VFDLYGDWYQRPKTVEMVLPNFVGAGQKAAGLVTSLMEFIRDKTEGKVDCTFVSLKQRSNEPSISQEHTSDEIHGLGITVSSLVTDLDALRRFGRLSMFMECIGNGDMFDCMGTLVPTMSNQTVLELSYDVWDEESRKAVWGHTKRYIPFDSDEKFDEFKQDISSIIYATSLNISDHLKQLVDCCGERQEIVTLVEQLRSLATQCLTMQFNQQLKRFLRKPQNSTILLEAIRLMKYIESVPELNSSECSRCITFVYRCCVGEMSPVRIPLPDIIQGFPQFNVTVCGDKQTLTLTYRESSDKTSVSLIAPVQSNLSITAKYVPERINHGDLVYPDYYILSIVDNDANTCRTVTIPKIGRECYDILGATNSAHAGLVIGFGCSVFHSSLQFVQIIATICGFHQPENLVAIQNAMFAVNPKLHHRTDLAYFQTQQLLKAIHDSAMDSSNKMYLTYKKHVLSNHFSRITEDALHKHIEAFVTGTDPDHEFDYYHQRIAYLAYHYSDLYPLYLKEKQAINPRISFYDGSNVVIDNIADEQTTVVEQFLKSIIKY
jgi:hypothetical protein